MARKNDRTYHLLLSDEEQTEYMALGGGPGAAPLTFKDRDACDKWIREHGSPHVAHQKVVFVGPAIFVHVEQTEKRTLAAEPDRTPDPEPEAPAE